MRRGAHAEIRQDLLLRGVPDGKGEDSQGCATCKHARQFKQSGFFRCALLPAWNLRVICAFNPIRWEAT